MRSGHSWAAWGCHLRLFKKPTRLLVGGIEWRTWSLEPTPPAGFPNRLSPFHLEGDRLDHHALGAALTQLDPDVVALVQRFHPLVRWCIYQRVADDESGRVAQLVETCPALLVQRATLDLWFPESRGRDADFEINAQTCGLPLSELVERARRQLHGARRGEERRGRFPGNRASQLVEEAVPWPPRSLPTPEVLPPLYELPPNPEPWGDRGDNPNQDQAHILRRMVYRRAPARITPAELFRATPSRVVLSDAPRAPEEFLSWYRLLCVADTAGIGHEGAGDAVVAFLSRHWRVVVQAGRGDVGASRQLVESLVHYVFATGEVPSRRTDPTRFLAAADRWHAGPAGQVQRMRQRLGLTPGDRGQENHYWQARQARRRLGLDGHQQGPLGVSPSLEGPPPPPVSRLQEGDLCLTALDAEGVVAEGAEMNHCVGIYAQQVERGLATIMRGECGPERFTVRLVPVQGAWYVHEARGARNSLVPEPIINRVRRLVGRLPRAPKS